MADRGLTGWHCRMAAVPASTQSPASHLGVDSPVRFTQTWPIVQSRSRAAALPATGLVGLASLGLVAILLIAILPR